MPASSSMPESGEPNTGSTRQPPLQPPQPLLFLRRDESSTEDIRRDPFLTPRSPEHLSPVHSAPGTPRHLNDGEDVSNPFSPPASVINFSAANTVPSMTYSHQTQSSISSNISISRSTSAKVSRPSSLRHGSNDDIHELPRITGTVPRVNSQIRNSFMSPPVLSRRATAYDPVPRQIAKRAKSTMLTGEIEKPWVTQKDVYVRLSYWVTWAIALIGVAAGAVRCYFGWLDVPRVGNLCLIMQDDFDTLNLDTWYREVDMGGFGNGEFQMTTDSSNNSYVQDGKLYIVPTLTSDVIGYDNIFNGYTYNISGCTSTNLTSCGAVSNSTTGAVINPVMSARLSTKNSFNIQYGRVEIVAKLPMGDWLWPALWMLPVKNVYGDWPASGEIDIMLARGNGVSYKAQGVNYVRSSLQWGPYGDLNGVSKTYGWWTTRRSTYAEGFHTYAVEWTDKFIRMYVDTRLDYMFELSFNEPFFDRGDFPTTVMNNESQYIVTPDPWVNGTKDVAPFDQQFYLLMDLAVGGTSGWFPDGVGDKPWLDTSSAAMQDFAMAQDTWYATWPENVEDRAFVIDSVKMWQAC